MFKDNSRLRKFKMNIGSIKRKAVAVIPTQCQHIDCQKSWDDKIYDPYIHKVICPRCNRAQRDSKGMPIILYDMDIQSIKEWGLSRDIAAEGQFGAHIKPGRKHKTMSREEFENIYGKQNL